MSNDAGQTPENDETTRIWGGDSGLGEEGSGNPDTDRAYLLDQAPAQVDEDAAARNAEAAGDEPGSDADAARD